MTNRMGWWDEDVPEFGYCHQCGQKHRLDLCCLVREERARMALVAILVVVALLAAAVAISWWLL